MKTILQIPPVIPTLLVITVMAGCDEGRDERLARMAQQSTQRQAEQNQELVRLNREVTEGTRRMVEAEARQREELLAMQRDLQSQQAEIGCQRDRLEDERKELAAQRERNAIIATVLSRLGELALCALPLVLCWYLLFGLRHHDGEQDAEAIGEILIDEVTAEEPRLLPPPATKALERPNDESNPNERPVPISE